MQQLPLELNSRGGQSHPWTVGLRLRQCKVQILKIIRAACYGPYLLRQLNMDALLKSIMAVKGYLGTVKLKSVRVMMAKVLYIEIQGLVQSLYNGAPSQ